MTPQGLADELSKAIHEGNFEATQKLLSEDADPLHALSSPILGTSALETAITRANRTGDTIFLRLILDQLQTEGRLEALLHSDEKYHPLLQNVCINGFQGENFEALELLLEYGISLTQTQLMQIQITLSHEGILASEEFYKKLEVALENSKKRLKKKSKLRIFSFFSCFS